jgi:hypothetical protein
LGLLLLQRREAGDELRGFLPIEVFGAMDAFTELIEDFILLSAAGKRD